MSAYGSPGPFHQPPPLPPRAGPSSTAPPPLPPRASFSNQVPYTATQASGGLQPMSYGAPSNPTPGPSNWIHPNQQPPPVLPPRPSAANGAAYVPQQTIHVGAPPPLPSRPSVSQPHPGPPPMIPRPQNPTAHAPVNPNLQGPYQGPNNPNPHPVYPLPQNQHPNTNLQHAPSTPAMGYPPPQHYQTPLEPQTYPQASEVLLNPSLYPTQNYQPPPPLPSRPSQVHVAPSQSPLISHQNSYPNSPPHFQSPPASHEETPPSSYPPQPNSPLNHPPSPLHPLPPEVPRPQGGPPAEVSQNPSSLQVVPVPLGAPTPSLPSRPSTIPSSISATMKPAEPTVQITFYNTPQPPSIPTSAPKSVETSNAFRSPEPTQTPAQVSSPTPTSSTFTPPVSPISEIPSGQIPKPFVPISPQPASDPVQAQDLPSKPTSLANRIAAFEQSNVLIQPHPPSQPRILPRPLPVIQHQSKPQSQPQPEPQPLPRSQIPVHALPQAQPSQSQTQVQSQINFQAQPQPQTQTQPQSQVQVSAPEIMVSPQPSIPPSPEPQSQSPQPQNSHPKSSLESGPPHARKLSNTQKPLPTPPGPGRSRAPSDLPTPQISPETLTLKSPSQPSIPHEVVLPPRPSFAPPSIPNQNISIMEPSNPPAPQIISQPQDLITAGPMRPPSRPSFGPSSTLRESISFQTSQQSPSGLVPNPNPNPNPNPSPNPSPIDDSISRTQSQSRPPPRPRSSVANLSVPEPFAPTTLNLNSIPESVPITNQNPQPSTSLQFNNTLVASPTISFPRRGSDAPPRYQDPKLRPEDPSKTVLQSISQPQDEPIPPPLPTTPAPLIHGQTPQVASPAPVPLIPTNNGHPIQPPPLPTSQPPLVQGPSPTADPNSGPPQSPAPAQPQSNPAPFPTLTTESQNCINLVDNNYLAEMLDILDPPDPAVWKIGLSRDGLVSFSRKATGYSPYVYKAETSINCNSADLFTLMADPSIRSKLDPYCAIEHWQYKRDRDVLVVTRALPYPDGRIVFVARSLPKLLNHYVPVDKGYKRLKLHCQLAIITPLPSSTPDSPERTYLQYMELMDYKLTIHQPVGLKTKSIFRKIELLDGLVTVYGSSRLITAANPAEEDDDGEED